MTSNQIILLSDTLESTRNKTKNIAVKVALSALRSDIALLYSADGDYDRACGANGQAQDASIAEKLVPIGPAVCGKPASGQANAYAILSKPMLPVPGDSTYYCIDSTGAFRGIQNPIASTTLSCPAN